MRVLTRAVAHVARTTVTLFLLLAAANASAASVDIAVTASDGSPATGVVVVLRNSLTGFEALNNSNSAGRARFAAVPAGPGYAVMVEGIELASGIR
ncbi:MAG: hypothetical protein WBN34_03875, partial [Woeseia sp.]